MIKKNYIYLTVFFMVIILTVPLHLLAQTSNGSTDSMENQILTQERLDELLAPIALYPDVLLSQILMASTYPLEVVEADRWLKDHPGLTGDNLNEALKDVSWDLSVKSLCHFPKVLDMMSTKLDFTTQLGNAYLNQKDQLMDTIQKLRDKARAAGSLASSDKENVTVEDQYISIEPVEPDVVYLPYYNPCWVYGTWWYPDCTPLWFWWPNDVIGGELIFGPPLFIGPLQGWCGFDWPHHHIFFRPGRVAFLGGIGITKFHGGIETWHHNPIHRRGVAYPSPGISEKFGQKPRPGLEARRKFRGFSPPGSFPAKQSLSAKPAPGMVEPRGRRTEGFSRPPENQGQIRSGFGTPESYPPFAGPRPMNRQQFRQPRFENPFEGFGKSGPEIRQFSNRGFQSMGRGFGGGMPRMGGFGGGGPKGGRK